MIMMLEIHGATDLPGLKNTIFCSLFAGEGESIVY